MKEYIFTERKYILDNFGYPQWTTVMKTSLKVLMDAKQQSFTKRCQVSWLFLNH